MAEHPEHILFIFLDGVGIGSKNESNPFHRFARTALHVAGGSESFSWPGEVVATDAHMGVEGLPQSATGQTALFTGFPAPQLVGRHINGYPTYSLRPYILNHSILRMARQHGHEATLLNSYTPQYLSRLDGPRAERIMSASSFLQKSSGRPFFTIKDYLEGKSLYMDMTNWFLRSKGVSIPLTEARESGRKAIRLARSYKLAVYEYFFTDKVGHEAGAFGAAKRIIRHVEDFLEGVWEEIDPSRELVIVSSDHGNMEDLSQGHHTNNPVLTLIHGFKAAEYASKIGNLADIGKLIHSFV